MQLMMKLHDNIVHECGASLICCGVSPILPCASQDKAEGGFHRHRVNNKRDERLRDMKSSSTRNYLCM